jgi:hypothetical protein
MDAQSHFDQGANLGWKRHPQFDAASSFAQVKQHAYDIRSLRQYAN